MKRKTKILSSNICSCRCLEIPPVSQKEIESIIRYKLSSFYPGSVDDLIIDYQKQGNNYAVFYISSLKLNNLKIQYPETEFLSSYHLFNSYSNKTEGKLFTLIDDRIEVFTKSDPDFFELKSLPFKGESESALIDDGYRKIENSPFQLKRGLFNNKKKSNYLLQIGILILIIALIPQAAAYLQFKNDSDYVNQLEIQLNHMLQENSKNETSANELEMLRSEYQNLMLNKPVSPYQFFSELSVLLGKDTEIDSIVLKNNSFQMNGRGYKPLNKMEGFQENVHFHSVIPYQVQAIDGSSKEKFSLTGFYDYE